MKEVDSLRSAEIGRSSSSSVSISVKVLFSTTKAVVAMGTGFDQHALTHHQQRLQKEWKSCDTLGCRQTHSNSSPPFAASSSVPSSSLSSLTARSEDDLHSEVLPMRSKIMKGMCTTFSQSTAKGCVSS